MNKKRGVIDSKGNVIIPFKFDKFEYLTFFPKKRYAQVKDGYAPKGYIETNGKWIVYKELLCDQNVVINANEKVIWPKGFDSSCSTPSKATSSNSSTESNHKNTAPESSLTIGESQELHEQKQQTEEKRLAAEQKRLEEERQKLLAEQKRLEEQKIKEAEKKRLAEQNWARALVDVDYKLNANTLITVGANAASSGKQQLGYYRRH